MPAEKKSSQLLVVLGISLASAALAGFLAVRRRRQSKEDATSLRQDAANSATITRSTPVTSANNVPRNVEVRDRAASIDAARTTGSTTPQQSVDVSDHDEDVVVQKIPGTPQTSLASDEDHIVVGHASSDSPPILGRSVSLSGLPPLKIVPSLKLLKDSAEMQLVCGLVADAALSSASSSERSTPRLPEFHHASVRRKLIRVGDLLDKVATCFEGERRKCLDYMQRSPATTGADESSFEWLKGIRRLEQSLVNISLRSLVGASRSTTLTSRLCSELALEVTAADELGDGAFVTANLMEHLKSFGAFLFAKEMITQGELGAQTKRLLFHSVDQLPEVTEEQLHQLLNNARENALVASVAFPVHKQRAIHEPWLWYLTGQVLEVQDGSVDVTEASSAVFELPEALRVAQRYFDVAYQPPHVAAYLMALVTSAGNLGDAWMGLALSLDADETVSIFGQSFNSLECIPQAIRCNGGSTHCSSFSLWTEAAALLEYASLSSAAAVASSPTRRSNSPTAIQLTVTTAAHAPMVPSNESPNAPTTLLTRRDCLIKAAEQPEASKDANVWRQLGMLLNIGKHLLPATNELVMEEEFVSVGGMTLGRFDCFALSAAIDPSSAILWYRIAVSLEDKAQMMNARANNVYADVDPKVYERYLLGSSFPPIDRETALLKALKEDPEDSKTWFVLATTLFERNGELVQPEPMRVRIPNYLLRLRRSSSLARMDSSVAMATVEGSPRAAASNEADATLVSAEDLFKKCIQTKPSLEPTVQKWIASHLARL